MKTLYRIALFSLLLVLSMSTIVAEDEKRESATLFPGGTLKVLGITVYWHYSVDSSQENIESRLEIVGIPKGTGVSIKIIDLIELAKTQGEGKPLDFWIYIDEVVLTIRHREKQFMIDGKKQKQIYQFDGAADSKEMFVSYLCPVYLNEWKISISEEKQELPDGSKYYHLIAEKQPSAEQKRFPLTEETILRLDRFEIVIRDVSNTTQTAYMGVKADIDRSIKGKDAYVEDVVYIANTSAEEFLTDLAQTYGFDITWAEYPEGHADSVEYAKKRSTNMTFSRSTKSSNKVLGAIIEDLSKTVGLGCEWETPTHLRVWAKDYDIQIKQQEEEKKFLVDYNLQTKIYPCGETMSAKTAKELIEPTLGIYNLFRNVDGPDAGKYQVRKGNAPSRAHVIARVEERAIIDEQNNALILTAVPDTHKQFNELFAKFSAMLEASTQSATAKALRLSITLLEARQEGAGQVTMDQPKMSSDHSMMGGMSMGDSPQIITNLEMLQEKYGISKEDMEFFGFKSARVLGQGMVYLIPERSAAGTAMVTLSPEYLCKLEYQDRKEPYYIIKGTLYPRGSSTNEADKLVSSMFPIMENSLYLELGKASTLGITNMQNALIVVVHLDVENEKKS